VCKNAAVLMLGADRALATRFLAWTVDPSAAG